MHSSILMIEKIADGLKELKDEVVFVGGSVEMKNGL